MSTTNAAEINATIAWLNKIDNSDWMPTAIRFLAEYKNDPEYVLWFITRQERLVAFLHITAKDVNQRIERYATILTEMENSPKTTLQEPLTTIELTDEEKMEFFKALDSEIYKMTARRRNYIILRLDSFVSDGAAVYDPSVLTIEHVLPQTVNSGSEWEKLWPDADQRAKWLNRIANLVPLTRRHNSQAQNYSFDVKKTSYFTGKNGTTSYSLTTQVIKEPIWTPSVIEHRQSELLNVFKDKWRL